jgi:site-specific DNA recombinase
VRAILANPRYTGSQVWNKQRRDEVLLDVDDVAAGHISRMRWNPRDQWVYSAAPTHPPLLSRETFDQVQVRIAARSRTSPRTAASSPRPYALRGRLTCGLCRRRLQGQWVHGQAYYRCRYPSEYAHSAGFDHPVNVYLREADLVPKLDAWLARLVSPANIEATCHRLATAAQPTGQADPDLRAAQQAVADCQRKLARHRAALEAGGDPAVISQWIAETTQQQRHAQDTLDQLRAASANRQQVVDPAMVRALLEELGDLAAGLDLADPQQRATFYQAMGVSGLYQPAERIVLLTAEPGICRPTVRVGGADWTTGPTGVHHACDGVEPCRASDSSISHRTSPGRPPPHSQEGSGFGGFAADNEGHAGAPQGHAGHGRHLEQIVVLRVMLDTVALGEACGEILAPPD